MRAIITGVGHYTPPQKLTNQDLEQLVDTSDEWITTRTGIKERRILEKDKGTSFMAVKAAKTVLQQSNVSPDQIDLIIVATVTPDMLVPSTAAFVQKGLKAKNCWGFDLNAGCTGFICALATGAQFVQTGRHKKVLVIGADKMSSIIDYQDRNTCVIFGDGAGAVLLEPSEEQDLGIEDFVIHLDGKGADYLNVTAGGSRFPASDETVEKRLHYVYQDGKTVFKHAVIGMADVSKNIMKRNHIEPEDIDLFIPHQANYRIIDAASRKMGIAGEKVIINIERYGNTTAATIPIAMSEAYQNKMMKKGDLIIISGFGAGFTWGSLLFKWAMK